ncbi:hypothetical protein [Methyloprofundus sp.]|uniref:hypothetical protein n=1 Tax=Methyloprofundus sp. TaxID=2020875 RepID=UPI003D097961
MVANIGVMKNTSNSGADKVRTTLYLTQENKQGLDQIPRGKKTALMNRAIAHALKELDKKENNIKFIEMISEIEPVNSEVSSEVMVQQLRVAKEISIATDQSDDE